MTIRELRNSFHKALYTNIISVRRNNAGEEYANFADGSNRSSREISMEILERIKATIRYEHLAGQTAGSKFETITKEFIENAFILLRHIRPGNWIYSTQTAISQFAQYEHLNYLTQLRQTSDDPLLVSALAEDYIVKPDIVIARTPVPDADINQGAQLVGEEIATLTSLRQSNYPSHAYPILHASISCKWSIRSDRAQNSRTEALNLIRNRKGHLPHIVVVTAEPLPTRLAAIALGTGDIDCTYHFALHELQDALDSLDNEDQLDMLNTLIQGKRLRDISDLPFDLAV